ncbi:hypothetical protein KTC96_24855 (plasmid) [Clostridium estertheticum]|uniref:hypothetical protein n=1 Tax=Clostridium estertheticum TaxID=238834 RepID=UPI001C7D7D41|nr:hypothetical protein [Clostridium estertheticum]MBX4259759.1 hypothetical protein [Clostridium estertheticum]WLC73253.1 hypothetical protein KTC96_24855 [Clostridium estertheticum]
MSKYINPIDGVIDNLRDERERRINAYNSGEFCDNETLKTNIIIITQGIIAMNNEKISHEFNKKLGGNY